MSRESNICFECQNALGGCCWTEIDPRTGHPRFQPVPGWTAEAVYRQFTDTYHITACPEFIPDPPRKISRERRKGLES